eukprot:8481462-Pyramimonas_sp.AAC.1
MSNRCQIDVNLMSNWRMTEQMLPDEPVERAGAVEHTKPRYLYSTLGYPGMSPVTTLVMTGLSRLGALC